MSNKHRSAFLSRFWQHVPSTWPGWLSDPGPPGCVTEPQRCRVPSARVCGPHPELVGLYLSEIRREEKTECYRSVSTSEPKVDVEKEKNEEWISSTKEATDYQKLVSNGPRAIPSGFRMSSLRFMWRSRACLMWGRNGTRKVLLLSGGLTD